MPDLLIAKSAVEKRRAARKNIIIAIIVIVVASFLVSFNGFLRVLGFLCFIYAIYKGLFNGILSLWINKE